MKVNSSVGGKSNEQKFSNECEKFDIEENKWSSEPSLNEMKLNVAAIAFQSTIIYVFGGLKAKSSNYFEILDTKAIPKVWNLIKIQDKENLINKEGMGCFQVLTYKIILFGGIQANKGLSDDVTIFDIESRTMEKMAIKLPKKEWFALSMPLRLCEGSVAITGNFSCDIHIFNKKNKLWEIINTSQWMK